MRDPKRPRLRPLYGWFWSRVAIPKVFTAATCGVYTFLLAGWIPGLLDPPRSLEGVVGVAVMYMIGLLVVAGAASGIPAAFAGVFRVERWSVIAVGTGVFMYVLIIHYLHFSETGNRLPQAQSIAALLPVLAARLHHVWGKPVGSDEETLSKET